MKVDLSCIDRQAKEWFPSGIDYFPYGLCPGGRYSCGRRPLWRVNGQVHCTEHAMEKIATSDAGAWLEELWRP